MFAVYSNQPSFPPSDQWPGATRNTTLVPGLWVDWVGTIPSATEVLAVHPIVKLTTTQANRASAIAAGSGIDATAIRQRAVERQTFIYLKQLFDAHNALVQALPANALSAAQKTANTLPVPTRATMKAAVNAIINADDPNA